MHGYTIVKFEADSAAVEDNVLSSFNEYMQSKSHARTPAFVDGAGAYFRIEYNDSVPATSAGIAAFGNFLQSSGYTINGISTAKTREGEEGTLLQFTHEGKMESVVVSTLNVY